MFNFVRDKNIKREFEENIIKHADSLYTIAFRMTQNRQDAEDLVQEASVKAYRFFHTFKRGSNFKAWIMTIVRNTYINQYRKKIKKPQEVALEEVENFIMVPGISEVQEETLSELIKFSVDQLADDLRTTLTLFYGEKFSYKEIAGIMDVPIGTVMSRLYTARQTLKKRLLLSARKERR